MYRHERLKGPRVSHVCTHTTDIVTEHAKSHDEQECHGTVTSPPPAYGHVAAHIATTESGRRWHGTPSFPRMQKSATGGYHYMCVCVCVTTLQ